MFSRLLHRLKKKEVREFLYATKRSSEMTGQPTREYLPPAPDPAPEHDPTGETIPAATSTDQDHSADPEINATLLSRRMLRILRPITRAQPSQ
ncbi:unnamed protein product [Microthlaspi erraticum]|uniref:Uncharacterized protein n=1 Tax=Microthlaspi erraticum TaxID=1685480 RepID=A0A6D2ITG0_9BRAS|nr:unnamed protein product [Microthlaspi erraticum]